MESFGKPKGFYNRQIALFKTLCLDQANVKDVETGKETGAIPHFDDIISFFSQRSTQPRDRGTFIHGDFKIDNVVFHKTEPKVIGILEYVLDFNQGLDHGANRDIAGKCQLSDIL